MTVFCFPDGHNARTHLLVRHMKISIEIVRIMGIIIYIRYTCTNKNVSKYA
jgi:hypothetical protein